MTEAKQGERKAVFLTPKVFEMLKALKEKEHRTYSQQLKVMIDIINKMRR